MIWTLLLKLVDPITGIAREIAETKRKAIEAQSDERRIEMEERVAALQARRDVLVKEGAGRINALFRVFIAAGPACYLFKIFVYDKILGWGATDDLSPDLWNVLWIVIGFYFLHDTAKFFRR